MTYQIDKNVPIPERKYAKTSRFDALVSQMKAGDSVEFPWEKDQDGNVRLVSGTGHRYSKDGQQFKTYLTKKKIHYTSRSLDTGVRIWLTEKK